MFLGWILFETLQNFTDYATILSFLPKCCKNSWITQRCFPSLSRMLWNFTNYATKLVWTSRMLRNFTDYATMLALTSGVLRNFTDYATKLALTSKMLWKFKDYATNLILTFRETTQSSQAGRQCPWTKLGFDSLCQEGIQMLVWICCPIVARG